MPTTTSQERRRVRSDVPREAVRHYLEALARQRGMRALVLAREDGEWVGVGEAGLDLGRLAAAGRACARGEEDGVDVEEMCEGHDLYAHAWTSDAGTFTLTSLGVRVARVRDVVSTVERIGARGR